MHHFLLSNKSNKKFNKQFKSYAILLCSLLTLARSVSTYWIQIVDVDVNIGFYRAPIAMNTRAKISICCVCVCVCERERERERDSVCFVCVCVCVCVCVLQ